MHHNGTALKDIQIVPFWLVFWGKGQESVVVVMVAGRGLAERFPSRDGVRGFSE
jgi:hypothetical protein